MLQTSGLTMFNPSIRAPNSELPDLNLAGGDLVDSIGGKGTVQGVRDGLHRG